MCMHDVWCVMCTHPAAHAVAEDWLMAVIDASSECSALWQDGIRWTVWAAWLVYGFYAAGQHAVTFITRMVWFFHSMCWYLAGWVSGCTEQQSFWAGCALFCLVCDQWSTVHVHSSSLVLLDNVTVYKRLNSLGLYRVLKQPFECCSAPCTMTASLFAPLLVHTRGLAGPSLLYSILLLLLVWACGHLRSLLQSASCVIITSVGSFLSLLQFFELSSC
jgi:hypothetical protein